jgi:hypothetical protein
MHAMQTDTSICPNVHTNTHKHTHKLSHTRRHKRMHTHEHTREICPQDRKHIKHTHNYIIPKVWLEAQQRLLRPHTLAAEDLLH